MCPSDPSQSNHDSERILSDLVTECGNARERLIEITRQLVQIPSETPPSDTRACAACVQAILAGIDGAVTTVHTCEPPVDNVVSVLKSGTPGKRLVFNGHLDTYPTGDHALWSDDPFSARLDGGRIYGRGAADMKGGIAGAIVAFEAMSKIRDAWSGELVLTLAGDEERMGDLGTKFLLDTVPEASGDAMLCADVGSPLVPRIGEKGMIWLNVFASGQSAHGAHVHRGVSAIDRLRRAMDALASLRDRPVDMPDATRRTIEAARTVSEPLAGEGETEVLTSITVNFGLVNGGHLRNLVADTAKATADIRLPNGTSVAEIEAEAARLLGGIEGVRFEVIRRYEPTWTDPDDPFVAAVCAAGKTVLGTTPVPNGRIGGSDARLYRAAGIPTVVCGLTPHNLGAADEFVEVDELVALAKIQAHAAFSYLSTP